MKVFHLINTLSAGGAEIHLLTLCRHLQRHGVEIAVACLRERVKDSRSLRSDFEQSNIPVFDLKADRRVDTLYLGKLARLMRVQRPDILHTHLPRADFAGAFLRRLEPRLLWVSSVHAIYSEDWSGRWSLPLFRLIWAGADSVLCISHAVQDWLVRRGTALHRTKVIHYGIELDDFLRPKIDLRQEWGLVGKALIGTVGRLEPRKGHEFLIRAVAELRRRNVAARLLIAGHDPWGYGRQLRRLIENLDVAESVSLLGFQSDVSSFLHAIDVFAFASSSEGFGQVVVEAMAAGKPVVVNKIAPLTEIVTDGETGLLVESEKTPALADRLAELLSHPDRRDRMGACARQKVEKSFSAERMALETLSLYEDLLQQRAPVRSFA